MTRLGGFIPLLLGGRDTQRELALRGMSMARGGVSQCERSGTMRHRTLTALVPLALGLLAMPAHGQRIMEKLGRGFVAVGGGTGTLLSWRLYGTEWGTDIAFNVYNGTTKLNSAPITNSTNYQDTASGTDYTLKAIVGGIEEATGAKALSLPNGYLEIPLKAAPGRGVKFGCVGDLDGDGEYEYVVDRQEAPNTSQYVDAYHRDGRFLWRIDMGPNSTNTSNSTPGPATIGFGHSDNEAVYDIDSDGKAELILKAANGTVFGDGKTLTWTNDTDAFIVAIDGVTGAEKGTRILVPNDNPTLGAVTGHFGIAYFDGVHPTLMFKGKWGGTAAMADFAFDFKDNAWSLRWKFLDDPIKNYTNNHQIRCLDLDGDGIDEFVNGGYARKADGSILWNMTSQGIVHGDRWHITNMDPKRGSLLGWGIGQNASYDWYEYDAKTGTVLRKYGSGGTDLSRGDCGDVDPTNLGYECWTGGKVFNMANLTGSPIGTTSPPQNFRIWWDGDVLSEQLDGGTISKWAYPGMPSGGFSKVTLPGIFAAGNRPPLYGDMFGDWREELMMEQSGGATLRIYTTAIPTEKRLYTLMHNPQYRNAMVEKGYTQSRFVDYYLGDGMTDPPKPNITYPDGSGTAGAGGGGTTGAAGASGSGGTTGAAGAGGGGTTASGGTLSTGGATGGRGGRGGSVAGSGGSPGTGGTTAVVGTGGAGMVGAGGTSAVVPGTGGGKSSGAGGAVGGQSGSKPVAAAADSGCSCAIGASSGRASAGCLVAMLGALGLVLNRRRRRGRSQE